MIRFHSYSQILGSWNHPSLNHIIGAADEQSCRFWSRLEHLIIEVITILRAPSAWGYRMKTSWHQLLGGLEHFGLFSHILGIATPTDFHIFQRGRVYHQPAKSWWRHGGHGVFDQRSPRGPLVSGIRWVHPSGPRGARYKPGSRLKDAPLFLDHMQLIQKVGAIRGVCNKMGRQEGER